MKNLIFILAITAIPLILQAQDNASTYFTIHIGLSHPIAPDHFSDFWTTGVNAGLGVGKQFSRRFDVMAVIFYNHFTLDQRAVENSVEDADVLMVVEGNPASVFTLFLKTRFNVSRHINNSTVSYFYAAAGLHHLTQDKITIIREEYETLLEDQSAYSPGIEFGLGADFRIETTTLFFEIGANIGFTDPDATIILPFKFGLRF